MSKILAAVLVLGVSIGGAYHAGILSVPGFGVEDRGDWGEVTDERIEVKTTAWMNNENPIGFSLNTFRADYRLKMNGVKLAEGRKKGLEVKEGNQTITLKTDVIQKNIPEWWARHIRNSEKSRLAVVTDLRLEVRDFPITVNGVKYTDTVETDLIGVTNNALEKIEGRYSANIASGLIPQSSQPKIEVRGGTAKWGQVSDNFTEIKFNFRVHNPNSYPIPTPQMAGDFNMNKVEVADWDANRVKPSNAVEKAVINSGETRNIKFTANVRNQKMDDWLTSHVRKNEKTDARIDLQLVFQFEDFTLRVPQGEGLKCQFNFQTAILEDNQTTESKFEGCENPLKEMDSNTDSPEEDSTTDSSDTDGTTDQNSSDTIEDTVSGLTG